MAVLPLNVSGDNALLLRSVALDMISARVGKDGGVELISDEAVKAGLGDASSGITDIRAALIGARLNADYVLYGNMSADGQVYAVDAKLLSIKDGAITAFSAKGAGPDSIAALAGTVSSEALSRIALSAPPAAPAPPAAAVKPAEPKAVAKPAEAAKTAPETAKDDGFLVKPAVPSQGKSGGKGGPFNGFYMAMASADLDKDGGPEFFLLGKDSVLVLRRKDGFEAVKEIKTPAADNAAITAIDTDGDGNAEIYVSGVLNNGPSTSVIEWKDGGYRVTQSGIKWLVRAMRDASGHAALAGQRFIRGEGFYGAPRVLKMQGGALVDAGAFTEGLPSRADIYRTEVFDATGAGSAQAVVLDQRGYIRIYDMDGKDAWKETYRTKEWFGGTLDRIEAAEDAPGAQKREPVFIEGGFMRSDLNNDGKPEVIVRRNNAGGLGRYAATPGSFTDGEIVSLSWNKDEAVLAENWKTKKLDGYIADFIVAEDKTGAGAELIMLVVEGTGEFSGGIKSYILSRRLDL
ncbi:MAG: VCBS repeat-containing protein [Deltaproteobacteria bacterium]|nr:VCBS repeat-containing protein [Deltaproteobacteria bacterium]